MCDTGRRLAPCGSPTRRGTCGFRAAHWSRRQGGFASHCGTWCCPAISTAAPPGSMLLTQYTPFGAAMRDPVLGRHLADADRDKALAVAGANKDLVELWPID